MANRGLRHEIQSGKENIFQYKEDLQNFKWATKQLEEQLDHERSQNLNDRENTNKTSLSSEKKFTGLQLRIDELTQELTGLAKVNQNLETLKNEQEIAITDLEASNAEKTISLEKFYQHQVTD